MSCQILMELLCLKMGQDLFCSVMSVDMISLNHLMISNLYELFLEVIYQQEANGF